MFPKILPTNISDFSKSHTAFAVEGLPELRRLEEIHLEGGLGIHLAVQPTYLLIRHTLRLRKKQQSPVQSHKANG